MNSNGLPYKAIARNANPHSVVQTNGIATQRIAEQHAGTQHTATRCNAMRGGSVAETRSNELVIEKPQPAAGWQREALS
eukprot:1422966-Pyramimonas_sp.AAC.1